MTALLHVPRLSIPASISVATLSLVVRFIIGRDCVRGAQRICIEGSCRNSTIRNLIVRVSSTQTRCSMRSTCYTHIPICISCPREIRERSVPSNASHSSVARDEFRGRLASPGVIRVPANIAARLLSARGDRVAASR